MNLVILLAIADAFYSGYILSKAKKYGINRLEEMNPIGKFVFEKFGFLIGSGILAVLAAFVLSVILDWNPSGATLILGVYFTVFYYHLLVGAKLEGLIEKVKAIRSAGVGEIKW